MNASDVAEICKTAAEEVLKEAGRHALDVLMERADEWVGCVGEVIAPEPVNDIETPTVGNY